MKVAFISLGCAKNLVNTEQMMALCRDAGHTLLKAPAGADAVVCTHVSNVFGYRLPVEGIAAACRKRGVPFALDASQSAGVLPVGEAGGGAATST